MEEASQGLLPSSSTSPTQSHRHHLRFDGIVCGGATYVWGGTSGPVTTFTFASGEQINSVTGRSGTMIDQLTFKTSLGRTYGPVGGNGGGSFSFTGPVYGFFGFTFSGCVSGLGFWTLASALSPPPPVVRSPSPPLSRARLPLPHPLASPRPRHPSRTAVANSGAVQMVSTTSTIPPTLEI
eukprot:jgi/Botrbrau1/10107/Bobra.20_2s0014.1